MIAAIDRVACGRPAGMACTYRRILFALCLSLPLLALVVPIDHDETQYVAAAKLLAGGLLPFRDFLYLQTPYQLFVLGPVFDMFDHHGFLVSRFLSGAMGAGAMGLVYAALREARVAPARAAASASLIWFCHAFLFGVTVVRNDALPLLLLSFALFLCASALDRAKPAAMAKLVVAGLALGAAAGAKLSYAAVAGAMVAFPWFALVMGSMDRRRAMVVSASVGAGVIAALAPILAIREWAPQAFDFGNFLYHAEAPFAWYEANGRGHKLTLLAKSGDSLLTLARGPMLVALVLYGAGRWVSIRRREPQRALLLLCDLAIAAGLVAMIAPTPTHRQYAIPLVAPLFFGLGLLWQTRAETGRRWGPWTGAFVMASLAIGAIQPSYALVNAMSGKSTPLSVRGEGRLLAQMVERRGLDGHVVTLSPEVVVDSGLSIDPNFATGPFAYRTGDMIEADERARLDIVSPQTVDRYLAARRPAAIVTGYENFDTVDAIGLERPIEAYAKRAGYERIDSPVGDAIFWLRREPKVAALDR